ncbi:ATP-binding cassette domain-containing protein, partial [Streptococcus suis]
YEVDSGTISIDGVNVHDMKREEVHDAFSMVLQDTWLFEGTIKENLIYNQKGITDEQVEAAAKAVGVHHFIKTLPNGYDS